MSRKGEPLAAIFNNGKMAARGACRRNSHYLLKAREYDVHRRSRELRSLLEDCVFRSALFRSESEKILEGKKSTFRIAFSCDGVYMASTHGSHEIVAFTLLPRCRLHRVLVGNVRSPWCLAFHPSEAPVLASGCLGGSVRLWDLRAETAEQCCWSSGQSQAVSSLCFHPRSQDLLLACVGRLVCLLTLAGGGLATLRQYTVDSMMAGVRVVVYSEDATQAVMAASHRKGPFPHSTSSHLLTLHLCTVYHRVPPDIRKFVSVLDRQSLAAGPDTCAVARGNLFYFSLKAATPLEAAYCIRGISLRQPSTGQVVFEQPLNATPFCLSLSPLGSLLLVTFQEHTAPCLLLHLDWPADDLLRPTSAPAESAQQQQLVLSPHSLIKSVNTAVFLPGLAGIVWGTSHGEIWLTTRCYSQ